MESITNQTVPYSYILQPSYAIVGLVAVVSSALLLYAYTRNSSLHNRGHFVAALGVCDGLMGIGCLVKGGTMNLKLTDQGWFLVKISGYIHKCYGYRHFTWILAALRLAAFKRPLVLANCTKSGHVIVAYAVVISYSGLIILGHIWKAKKNIRYYTMVRRADASHMFAVIYQLYAVAMTVLILITNIALCLELRNRSKSNTFLLQADAVRNIRMAQSLVIICALYLMTWWFLALGAWVIGAKVTDGTRSYPVLIQVAWLLGASSPTTNFFVYIARSKEYRRAFSRNQDLVWACIPPAHVGY